MFSRDAAARRGSSAWGLLVLALAVGAIAWFFRSLVRDIEAAEFTRVDPFAVRLDVGPGWVDPRWEGWLAQRIAELPDMSADAPGAAATLSDALLDLPFIAEVGGASVLWPDGLRIEVRFREPIACVRVGDGFALVSDDGVVLPGAWSAPPPRDQGYFPLIAAELPARDELQSGAYLVSPCWVDGLAVARTLQSELRPDDWIRLGRVVIDARQARFASVEHPGVVLWLEGGRRAYFGRAPNVDEPGELPVTRKCAALSRALRLDGAGEQSLDWELIDLRWDRPEVLPRGGVREPESENTNAHARHPTVR